MKYKIREERSISDKNGTTFLFQRFMLHSSKRGVFHIIVFYWFNSNFTQYPNFFDPGVGFYYYENLKWISEHFLGNFCAVRVRAPLSEGVEPQSLHWPAVCHSLRTSALRVVFQLTAGSSPWGQSFIRPYPPVGSVLQPGQHRSIILIYDCVLFSVGGKDWCIQLWTTWTHQERWESLPADE